MDFTKLDGYMITELVLRLKPDGTFSAGHAGDETGKVVPIVAAELPALIKAFNAAAVLKVDALRAERDALKAQIDAIKAERDTWKENAKPERDRQRAKAMARLAEAKAEVEKYVV